MLTCSRRPRILALIASLLLVLLLASCGSSTAPAPAAPPAAGGGTPAANLPNPIPVAVVDIFTGQAVAYGEAARKGHDLAMEEINTSGGILGSKLKFIYEDEAGKPEQAVQAVTKVINSDKVIAILGPGYTPSALASAKVNEDAKIPAILPIPSAASVSAQGYKYLFRSSPNDLYMGKQLAEFVIKRTGKKKFGIIAYNNDLGKSGVDMMTQYVKENGAEMADVELVNQGDKDFTGQLAKIKAGGIEDIFIWTQHTEAALIARQAQERNQTLHIYGGTLLSSPKLMELGGDAVNGVIFANTFNASDASGKAKAFVDAFRKKYSQDPDNFSAQAYDAVYLLKAAIEKAQSVDGTKLRDALAGIKGFSGALGDNMDMLPAGDLNIHYIFVQVKDGKWATIK